MKITFTELEKSDQRQFEEALGAHELSFVPSLADVLPDTEVLSVFISSCITDDFLARHERCLTTNTQLTTTHIL